VHKAPVSTNQAFGTACPTCFDYNSFAIHYTL
jgi:hypothetical protein